MQDFPNNQSTAPDRLRDASPRILIDQHAIDLDLESEALLHQFQLQMEEIFPLEITILISITLK